MQIRGLRLVEIAAKWKHCALVKAKRVSPRILTKLACMEELNGSKGFGEDFRIGIVLCALGVRRASPKAMAHR